MSGNLLYAPRNLCGKKNTCYTLIITIFYWSHTWSNYRVMDSSDGVEIKFYIVKFDE